MDGDPPIRVGAYSIEPGRLAARRFEVRGIVAGRAPIVVEYVTRLDDVLGCIPNLVESRPP